MGSGRALIVHRDGRIESEHYTNDTVRCWEPPQTISNRGYMRIRVMRNGKQCHMSVHRLLAECFIPNPENKPQINHKNGDKTDNRLSNLEWTTGDENIVHAIKNGIIKSKPVIRQDRNTGEIVRYRSVREAERDMRTGTDTIRNYCKGTRKQPKDYIWSYAG